MALPWRQYKTLITSHLREFPALRFFVCFFDAMIDAMRFLKVAFTKPGTRCLLSNPKRL